MIDGTNIQIMTHKLTYKLQRVDTTSVTGTTADESANTYLIWMQKERKGTNFVGFSDRNDG